MKQRLGHRSFAVIALAAIGLAACGGGGSDDASDDTIAPAAEVTVADTEAPEETTAPDDTEPDDTEPADTAPESGGVEAVQPSIIQIEAIGTIRDPEVGDSTGAGRGSGFVISDDGLAVTNNHVVTGAGTLEVFIGGDSDNSYNATILGVSECNDLALIDIDEDDPLPVLNWYEGEVNPGKEIYVAGFPLGDPEYTLTRGVISKVEADGDTGWASLDSVYEHDANAQPGNSGGPLVSTDGEVVGVHYASGSQTNTSQFFAIPGDTAQEVVEKLKDGDFESIGVNGEAIVDEEAGIAGIWVSGVAPGSPADDVELLPGDIIQTMNGVPVGTDGTKSAYCDVLRTSGEKPIKIEVLRFDTSEILTGEINGDDEDSVLQQTFSFAQAAEEEGVEVEEGTTTYDSYTDIVDDTGALTISLPTAWTSVDTAPATLDDGTLLPQITGSPDLESYFATWDTPGIQYFVWQSADINEVLATFGQPEACVDGGRYEYQDAAFLGTYQVWTNCGGTATSFWVLGASTIDGSEKVAVLTAQVVTDADLDALDQAFATFNVTG
jgi:serine protease Do